MEVAGEGPGGGGGGMLGDLNNGLRLIVGMGVKGS